MPLEKVILPIVSFFTMLRILEHIINNWVSYIGRQIVADKYLVDCVINVEEANVAFYPSLDRTLHKSKGSSYISGHSGGCTVRLKAWSYAKSSYSICHLKGDLISRLSHEYQGPHIHIRILFMLFNCPG